MLTVPQLGQKVVMACTRSVIYPAIYEPFHLF